MKPKIILAALCSLSGLSVMAQTNFTIVTRTNIIQAAPNFRKVDGQLYNTSISKLWKIQTGKIAEVQESGIILQTFTKKKIYQNVFIPAHGQPGAYGSASGHYQQRVVSTELIPAQRIFIKNYSNGAVDQEISIPAMKTGTVNIGDKVLEQWDCGLPNFGTNIVTSKVPVNP